MSLMRNLKIINFKNLFSYFVRLFVRSVLEHVKSRINPLLFHSRKPMGQSFARKFMKFSCMHLPFLSFLNSEPESDSRSPIEEESSTEIVPIIHTQPPIPIVEPAIPRPKPKPDLVITDDHAALSNAVFRNLLKERKLSLVLDLDHTLFHSTPFKNLSLEEQDLILKQTEPKRVLITEVFGEACATKLRPGLAHFLEEASKMYSLHVFTMSTSAYASKMLELIDPGRVYFECESRIFTRENFSTGTSYRRKTLDLVVGEPKGILIVDDLEFVWEEKDRENLIVIPRYSFFSNSRHGEDGDQSQLVMGSDESEADGNLNSLLETLLWIHEKFFDEDRSLILSTRDVRKLKKDFYRVGE